MINIALGTAPLSTCVAGDADNSGTIEISEIIRAVKYALNGCPQDQPTPTQTPTGTPTETPMPTPVRMGRVPCESPRILVIDASPE
jgi:hypothetical protein